MLRLSERVALPAAAESGGQNDSTRRAIGTGAGVILCLSGVVPLLLIGATGGGSSDTWLWPLSVTVFSGLQYSLLIIKGEQRLYELVVWLFSYLFLGLAPMVQFRRDIMPSTTPWLYHDLDGKAFIAIWAGLLAFAVGSRFKGRQRPRGRGQGAQQALSEGRVLTVTICCLAASAFYVAKLGMTSFLENRENFNRLRVAVWPEVSTQSIISAAGSISLLVALGGLLQVRRSLKQDRRLRVNIAITLVSIMLVITVNPVSSARYVFGTVALSAAALCGAFATPRRFRISAVALLAGLILVFPYADRFRTENSPDLLSKGGVTTTLTSGDFDSWAQINNSISYIETEPMRYGRQALGTVFFWVPRGVWPDKPRDTGIVIAEARGYGFTNLSAPLWSELLMNGGWPLLVLGFGALGVACRRAGERLQRAERAYRVTDHILPFYLIIILRGSLLQATGGMVVFYGAAWLLHGRSRPDPDDDSLANEQSPGVDGFGATNVGLKMS